MLPEKKELTKTCPRCIESIDKRATVCRHCNYRYGVWGKLTNVSLLIALVVPVVGSGLAIYGVVQTNINVEKVETALSSANLALLETAGEELLQRSSRLLNAIGQEDRFCSNDYAPYSYGELVYSLDSFERGAHAFRSRTESVDLQSDQNNAAESLGVACSIFIHYSFCNPQPNHKYVEMLERVRKNACERP